MHIQAFRGLRYDLGHVGSLSDVIAPPYDVIDAELQDELYNKHPANVVRMILNRDEPGDDEQNNRYSRAAQFLRSWRSQGVLTQEGDPAVYAYHQTFTAGGETHTRRGFMAAVKIERFGEGNIFPHEETHSAAKADRLKLITACKTNMSQIFGLYPDEENAAQQRLEDAIAGSTPLECTDHLGVVHRMWPVTDVSIISEISGLVGEKPMYVADGHHRYETACNYRDQLAAENGGSLPDEHPANYVLCMLVSMSDPGMLVLPTHRLFRGFEPITSEELIGKLDGCFDTRVAGEGPDMAGMLWESMEMEDEQGTLSLFCNADERWVVAKVNDKGREEMKQVAADHTEDWQELGVSLLHRLVIENLLGKPEIDKPMYVHDVPEVIEGLENGDTAGRDATGQQGSGGKFELAALVMPASLEHVRLISNHGERMPAKSTYFYPKLLSGLVFNPLS
jgi:uncharacterized protein (DUF1015 family)